MKENPLADKSCLIIGIGSIGFRHASILASQGGRVVCISSRKDLPWPAYADINEAISKHKPTLAAITSRTCDHLKHYLELAESGFAGKLLLEKPAFKSMPEILPDVTFKSWLGYDLRFHPVVRKMRELITGRKIFSAQLTVGQYLPAWRPGTDYRKCYSAIREQGGGVLRDLSHELDAAMWLFGLWKKVCAVSGNFGSLEIDCEDTVDVIGVFEKCPVVSIHLDYQNIFPKRVYTIQAEGMSLEGDLVKNRLRANDEFIDFRNERDDAYLAEWRDIALETRQGACTLEEGLEVLKLIEVIEKSSAYKKWEENL